MFDGETYNAEIDKVRLKGQLDRVLDEMIDGQWHTLSELHSKVGGSEAAISARIRDFRKKRFGGHSVDRERVPGHKGLWRYRLVLRDGDLFK